MKKIRLTALAVLVPTTALGLWFYHRADAHEASTYRTATVQRGTLQSSVSATGSLNAVRTVQVGTQVSGQLSAIYVDFNDKVKKGQLLARIDPTLQEAAVQDAQAQLAKAQAQLNLAKESYERNRALHDQKIITETEYQVSQTDYAVGQSTVRSAQISLDRARQNLSYTSIYSPIDGVIVERNVDVGQTVAASLSAPQLFLIANDLSQMQILASVDESDIGMIKEGQAVKFTVQSYPNQTFSGSVSQVRLQSKVADNVVNYTVVVGVANPGGKLLPGMTATLGFTTGLANDVMLVPSSALRFRPTDEQLAAAGLTSTSTGSDSTRSRFANMDSTARAQFIAQRRATNGGQGATSATRQSAGTLYVLDANGRMSAIRVRTGLSDGQRTEVSGSALKEGIQVIVGTSSGAAASGSNASPSSPLQPQQRGPRGF
jgi:HlyD family secretion protein